eukprot:CCRYP_001664-RB/>CCRYP_001664-RB protein AED:0.04 eAED:0.04 QI:259/1/1/1/1/1/2/268/462
MSLRFALGTKPQCAFALCPVQVAPLKSVPRWVNASRRLSSLSPSHRTRAISHYPCLPTLNCSLEYGQVRWRLRIPTTAFSSKTASNNSAVAANANATSQRLKWKLIARIAYYLRIPFLVLSVYSIGYQQGIMDYSRDPKKMEASLLDTILAGVGCISTEDRAGVLVAYEGEWRTILARFRANHRRRAGEDGAYDEEYRRVLMLRNVAVVGERIVKVAQAHVKQKLKEAVRDATSRLPPEVLDNETRLYSALEELEEVELWTRASRHMEGPWKYVLIPSSLPNAFVSEILPHRIFITTSLLQKFVSSQDELALVLGHEISHLILGHSSAQNSFETSFRTIEILLLSIDPSEGLLSLAFMSFLASVRGAIGASYSRENERTADELGIKLTAMACYNTREASQVFHKMHLHNIESGMESSSSKVGWGGLLSFFDSHPPSDERFRSLLEVGGLSRIGLEIILCLTN